MNESAIYEPCAPATPAGVTASQQGRRLNLWLWILLCVTNLVDVLATRRAFDLGIGELNPIVETFFVTYGIGSVAIFKALFLGMLWFTLPWIRSWTRALLGLACAAYFALTLMHIWYLSPLL